MFWSSPHSIDVRPRPTILIMFKFVAYLYTDTVNKKGLGMCLVFGRGGFYRQAVRSGRLDRNSCFLETQTLRWQPKRRLSRPKEVVNQHDYTSRNSEC